MLGKVEENFSKPAVSEDTKRASIFFFLIIIEKMAIRIVTISNC